MLNVEVRSGEVRLAVREHPCEGAPTVILVHGFPDTQAMWDPMAQRLNGNHLLRVVTYDTRGAGASTAPTGRSGYRVERLVDDLVAVMDAICPDAPMHLVGHDWGSIQLWEAVTAEDTDGRLHGRISTFTSISGPPLSYTASVLRRAARERNLDLLRSQARKSWYVAGFQLPWLPELVVRGLHRPLRARLNSTQRLDESHWADTFASDAAHGINLYRSNSGWLRSSPPPGSTDVPVLLVVPELDQFLDARLYDDLPTFVPNLTRVDVRAGHWVPRTSPDLIAGLVADHVASGPEHR